MTNPWAFRFFGAVLFLSGISHLQAQAPAPGTSEVWKRSALATVNPLATQAGIKAFEAGGNAVDAAIAAAVTLAVVDSHNSGLGGGCFLLIRTPDGTLSAIDGRETAPAGATRDMFVRDGTAVPELSRTGPLACGVPGSLAAWSLALKKWGRLSLAQIVGPAAQLAEAGFPIDAVFADKLAATASTLAQFEGSRAVFLKSDASPYQEGELLRQPDLAATLREIAKEGSDAFYKGRTAALTESWMKAHGGLLTASDFAAYEPRERQPILSQYRGCEIVGFPPPSSGGVHVSQILSMLDTFDLGQSPPAERAHLTVEAMKLAFADRSHWLGDPDFVHVPQGLIDPAYIRSLSEKIDPAKSTPVDLPGQPPLADTDWFEKHTTHVSAADAEGTWVAMTSTINTSFGSKVVIPGTGLLLNNEMDDFSAQPGTPNAFRLVSGEANAVAPGKRPLSSMSPTLVLRDGKPFLSLGAAGGPTIITQVTQALLHVIDERMGIQDALAAPRLHHQWRPDVVRCEKTMPADIVALLQAKGHTLEMSDHLGVSQGVQFDPVTGRFTAAHDPRIPGLAAGR